MQWKRKNSPEPTPDSQWDDIPGFDPDKATYVPFDKDAWLRDNGIREIARDRGQKDQPHAEEPNLDDIHQKILDWVNQRGRKCHSDVSRYLADLTLRLTDIENEESLRILEQEVERKGGAATLEIQDRIRHGRDELVRLGKSVREGTLEYEDFRKEARLHRLPQEGRRGLYLLAVLGVLETILNASLLMEVNAFGLLGAFTQMGLITTVNILIGALAVGAVLRYCNHVSFIRRAAAWLVLMFVIPLVGGFNLLVGHFRDSMQAFIQRADLNPLELLTNDTWTRLTNAPLGFESFQSSLLVILGLLFFSIASWKGYQWDDPYPGYGRRHRQLNALQEEYRLVLNGAGKGVWNIYEERTEQLKDILHQLEIKDGKWKDLDGIGRRLVKEYPLQVEQYQRDLEYLITAYRTANREARSEREPDFFNKTLKLDPGILDSPSFDPPPAASRKTVADRVHETILKLQQVYEAGRKQLPQLEDITAPGFASEFDERGVYELTHEVTPGDNGERSRDAQS